MNSTFLSRCIVVLAACASLVITSFAIADGGHDHGDAKPVAGGPALPRFTAQSDLFEAVGVLSSDEFSVLIDRTASNEPVLKATVELESGGVKLVGQFHADHGDYSFDAKPFAKAGVYPITLTIKAGTDADLLTGELDVHDASTTQTAHDAHAHGWQEIALWTAAILAAITLFFFGGRFALIKSRGARRRVGGSV
jgi:hypothetical protein